MIKVQRCCCFNLVTAGLIIGWLGVVGSLLACFSSSSGQVHRESNSGSSDNANESGIIDTLQKYQNYFVQANSNYFKNIANVIISVCLIYGTMQRKRLFLLPWLIKEAIALVLLIILIVVGIVAAIIVAVAAANSPPLEHEKDDVSAGAAATIIIIFIIFILLVLALSIYFWIVIYSLYDFIFKGEQANPSYTYSAGDVEGGGRTLAPINK